MIIPVLTLCLLSIFTTCSWAQYPYGYPHSDEYKELAVALNYGDVCDFEGEELRHLFGENGYSYNISHYERISQIIVENQLKLCNNKKMLVCDKETASCICGDVWRSSANGITLYTSQYYLAESVSGTNMECRRKVGTTCMYDDFLYMTDTPQSNCQTGTHCMELNTRKMCSHTTMVNYWRGTGIGGENLVEAGYEGLMCRCR